MKIYFADPNDPVLIDCPDCGGTAVEEPDGSYECCNDDCPSNQ